MLSAGLRQKVYLKDSLLNVSPKRRLSNANTRPAEEVYRAESAAVHEDLQGLRRPKRGDGDEVPQVPQQEPAVEEERTHKVNALTLSFYFAC